MIVGAGIVLIACFCAAVAASVMISAASFAVGKISRDSIRKLMENKVVGAGWIYMISGNRRRFHLMLLSGRTISVAAGTACLFAFTLYADTGPLHTYTWNLIAASFFSLLAFVFAEAVVSRLVSMGEYEDTVPRFAFFLFITHIILYPLTILLDGVLSLFIKEHLEMAAKEEALIELVKSESEAGVIEREEKEMIEGVLEFSDTVVREVMVPRIDVVAVEKSMPVDELIELFETKGHSRIPVYEGRIDNILGVIYAKDILPVIAERGKENLSIIDTMRKPYFVHETKKISDLLAEFKKAKVHLAIVVDEYGGTAGIVALEDILEEIVGDIYDEYDRDERDYLWINDRSVLMDAGLDIDDVNDILHSDIEDGDYDTLGGFIYDQLGAIPKGGEEFKWENLTFTIKQIDGNRISKVMVQLEEPLLGSRGERGES